MTSAQLAGSVKEIRERLGRARKSIGDDKIDGSVANNVPEM
jgi:hypothetical protein